MQPQTADERSQHSLLKGRGRPPLCLYALPDRLQVLRCAGETLKILRVGSVGSGQWIPAGYCIPAKAFWSVGWSLLPASAEEACLLHRSRYPSYRNSQNKDVRTAGAKAPGKHGPASLQRPITSLCIPPTQKFSLDLSHHFITPSLPKYQNITPTWLFITKA